MTTVPVTIQERIPAPMIPIGRPGGAPAGSMSVGDVVRVLKQRIFLIVFIWFFVTGATAGLTYYLAKEHPRYRSRSLILVESPIPPRPGEFEQSLPTVDVMDRFVADQINLLTDELVLREALQDNDLRSTDWFRKQDPTLVLEELKNDLKVVQSADSSYVIVSFSTENPQDAPRIVNSVIKKYLAKVQERTTSGYTRQLEDSNRQEARIKQELESIRQRKKDFIINELSAPGVTTGLDVLGETWRQLAENLTKLEAQKLLYKAMYDNLKAMDPNEIALSPQTQLMIKQDYMVQSLEKTLMELEQSRMYATQRLGEHHRSVTDIAGRIEAVEVKLHDLYAEKEREARDYQLHQAETNYVNAIHAEADLKETVLEAESARRDLDQAMANYQTLEEEQKSLEEQAKEIRAFNSQLFMLMQGRDTVRVQQIGQAQVPLVRHFPRWEYLMPAGAFLGLLLGVGLAFLLDLIDSSIKTSRDLVRHVHVPILGTVPDLDDEEIPIDRMELACHTAPRSMIAEAFRAVRTNLLLSSPAERQRTVLITSSKPEEGRTSVAANLAISIGQSGRRVLLVDANFHRPALQELFPKARREGLSNILIGQARLEDLVSPTDIPNLDVLTTGPVPPNPTELLAGRYFREMIGRAADRYDQVIFDGPPVLLVSDALVLAGTLDGVILVCRAKTVSRGAVQRAREQIERVNGRIFGAVLNAAQVSRGGYFREQMRTYYDYQTEASLSAEVARAALPHQRDEADDDAAS